MTAPAEGPTSAGRRLRVTQINTWDRWGGAERVATRLHEALAEQGHAARLVTGFGGTSARASRMALVSRWPRWKRALRRATLAAEDLTGLQYQLIWWSQELLDHPWVREAEVVHLHNLHGGYLAPGILPALSRRAAVVWTLHDFWALTGHCTFPLGCRRWRTGCGECPQLNDYPDLWVDTTALLWQAKRKLYARADVTVVAPSEWLAGLARQSPLLGRYPVHVIPNGVDTDTFRPVPRAAAREAFGLPPEDRVLLFVSSAATAPRKGAAVLLEALRRLPDEAVRRTQLLTVGDGNLADQPGLRMPVRALGRLSSEPLLAAAYAAADVVVYPSLEESFGQVAAEALACGTPCVAFRTSAIPEVVDHLHTGYLARCGDADDLAEGIALLLQEPLLRHRLGIQGREFAERVLALPQQVTRYVSLYHDALARWGGLPARSR